ncbi:MAG: cobalamin-binding protein [Gammaproteobacteria bacterium]|nr:cobalamin-binding protein [Gammaproteobacteria bacterium]MDH3767634.1 cobalamin-binding protein [Gammaproteobacteria bacterium]
MRTLLTIGACIFLVACSDRNTTTTARGNLEEPLRIVSLAPHLTELLYTAGAGDMLVGVVAHSDYPEQARSVRVIGDAFRIDPERLAEVEPDLILAWQGGNPDEVIDQLISRGYTVVRLSADRITDIPKNLIEIGKLAGTSEIAVAQAGQFSQAMERLARTHANKSSLKVFYQISLQPLYTVGGDHPISDIIKLCGGENLFADLKQLAPIVSLEDVLSRNPDVIVAGDDRAQLDQWLRWNDLRAAINGNLFVVDASLVTRASTRMLQGAKQICAHLDRARTR